MKDVGPVPNTTQREGTSSKELFLFLCKDWLLYPARQGNHRAPKPFKVQRSLPVCLKESVSPEPSPKCMSTSQECLDQPESSQGRLASQTSHCWACPQQCLQPQWHKLERVGGSSVREKNRMLTVGTLLSSPPSVMPPHRSSWTSCLMVGAAVWEQHSWFSLAWTEALMLQLQANDRKGCRAPSCLPRPLHL